MQATLTFNLPEDRELFGYYNKVMDYRAIINDHRNWLRSQYKSGLTPTIVQVSDNFGKLLAYYDYDCPS
jgi:hypothetical protein